MKVIKREFKIYKHTFPNNKVYIGITQQEPEKRWKNGYGYKKNSKVFNAIMKYGWINVEHEILYDNLTKEEAEELEREYIKLYKSTKKEYGYNVANGGNYAGKQSEETKKKIGDKNRGKLNGMWGKHEKRKKFTKEQRKKCSISHMGKKLSEEAKEKISKKVICVETNIVYKSIAEAQRQNKCYHICNCCKDTSSYKTAGGYHWRYYYENN